LSEARQLLADVTRAEHPHVFVEPSLRKEHQLLGAKSEKVRAHKGVLGYGIGRRIRSGLQTDELCALVFVEKKLAPTELKKLGRRPLPRTLSDRGGVRLPVDVVELGTFRRYAMLGSSVGPDDPQQRGTIGSFASGPDSKIYAITAMHVSEVEELTVQDPPIPFYVPSRMDSPSAVRFGQMIQGTTRGIDAGKILLDRPGDALSYVNGIGHLKGWRPVVDPADRGARVRMSGAVSGVRTGSIVSPNASMQNPDLDSAIVVQIDAAPGDSGAPLVDDGNLLVGILVGGGQGSNLNVFSPIGLVLNRLGCDIQIPT
jgi:hypothetical protein